MVKAGHDLTNDQYGYGVIDEDTKIVVGFFPEDVTAERKLDAFKAATECDIATRKLPLEDRKKMKKFCNFHPENISQKLAELEAAWKEKKKKEKKKK